jgi:hypothetical protein
MVNKLSGVVGTLKEELGTETKKEIMKEHKTNNVHLCIHTICRTRISCGLVIQKHMR